VGRWVIYPGPVDARWRRRFVSGIERDGSVRARDGWTTMVPDADRMHGSTLPLTRADGRAMHGRAAGPLASFTCEATDGERRRPPATPLQARLRAVVSLPGGSATRNAEAPSSWHARTLNCVECE
jgi:hypothetical protein